MDPELKLEKTGRILVVKMSSLGDVVNTLPAFSMLRSSYPMAKIAWVIDDHLAEILAGPIGIDEVIPFPRQSWSSTLNARHFKQWGEEFNAFRKKLRHFQAEVAIDFQGNAKSSLVLFLSAAKIRVGYHRGLAREGNWLFTNYKIQAPGNKIAERHCSLVRALGAKSIRTSPLLPVPSLTSGEQVQSFLTNVKQSKKPVVLIHPGASHFGAFKMWPESYFTELVSLLSHHANCTIVLTGSGEEREMSERIAASNPSPWVKCAPALTLRELAHLISEGFLFIGNDAGPLHLAAILGIPTISVFGPKDPNHHGPFGNQHVVHRNPHIPCSPCKRRTCPATICLTSILPLDVFASAKALLQARGTHA